MSSMEKPTLRIAAWFPAFHICVKAVRSGVGLP
jgi:hypothetical protein